MKYIVYVSQAAKPFSKDELSRLLEHSRKRNKLDEITGLLIYRFKEDFNRGNFVQVLEGPSAAIDDVWNRISNDQRHHTIVVIEEDTIENRMFADWSMGFRNIDQTDLRNFEGSSDLGTDAFWNKVNPENANSALELLKSFYDGT